MIAGTNSSNHDWHFKHARLATTYMGSGNSQRQDSYQQQGVFYAEVVSSDSEKRSGRETNKTEVTFFRVKNRHQEVGDLYFIYLLESGCLQIGFKKYCSNGGGR